MSLTKLLVAMFDTAASCLEGRISSCERSRLTLVFSLIIRTGILFSVLSSSGCAKEKVARSVYDIGFYRRYGNCYDYCALKVTPQSQRYSCGSACLVSVLDYWGVDVTEEQIFKTRSLPQNGYSIYALKRIAEENGLAAYAFLMSEYPLEELEEQLVNGRPVICSVDLPYEVNYSSNPTYGRLGAIVGTVTKVFRTRRSHYVIVFGFNKNSFLVVDPSSGYVSFAKDEFERHWAKKEYAVLLCGKMEYDLVGKEESGKNLSDVNSTE